MGELIELSNEFGLKFLEGCNPQLVLGGRESGGESMLIDVAGKQFVPGYAGCCRGVDQERTEHEDGDKKEEFKLKDSICHYWCCRLCFSRY